MERAIYAVVVDEHRRPDAAADDARLRDNRARCAKQPGYRRRLELRAGGWAIRADCYLFATAEAATTALATLDLEEGWRARAALLLDEGACPGVDDVTLLRAGRRERFALALPTIPLW